MRHAFLNIYLPYASKQQLKATNFQVLSTSWTNNGECFLLCLCLKSVYTNLVVAYFALVSFAVVIRVVTQRSSQLTAAHERNTFLSLKLTSKKQASIFWKPGPSPSPLLESKHWWIYLLLFQKCVNNSSLAS